MKVQLNRKWGGDGKSEYHLLASFKEVLDKINQTNATDFGILAKSIINSSFLSIHGQAKPAGQIKFEDTADDNASAISRLLEGIGVIKEYATKSGDNRYAIAEKAAMYELADIIKNI